MNSDKIDIKVESEKLLHMRNMEIALHNLKAADDELYFFYDETNNFRKLYLRDGAFNVQKIGNFVLGGVVFKDSKKDIPLAELRKTLHVGKDVNELKLSQIGAKGGTFFDLIQKKKMCHFLNWFAENNLLLHFSNIEPFYWSVVDIIDSILINLDNDFLNQHNHPLKSDLSECIGRNLSEMLNLFERFQYPSIRPEERQEFIANLLSIVVQQKGAIDDQNYDVLVEVLEQGLTCDELPFIDKSPGDIPGMLIEKFGPFYRQRIILFKNSVHLFDEEVAIKSFLKADTILPAIEEVRYDFYASEQEASIQISDMTMGLMGKLFMETWNVSLGSLEESFFRMNEDGKNNLKILNQIMDRSLAFSHGLQHHVTSLHDRRRTELLLCGFSD